MKNFFASAIFALAFFAIPTSANAAFHDVSVGHANSTAIEFVQNENIVAGYSDGNFRPDAKSSSPSDFLASAKSIVIQIFRKIFAQKSDNAFSSASSFVVVSSSKISKSGAIPTP